MQMTPIDVSLLFEGDGYRISWRIDHQLSLVLHHHHRTHNQRVDPRAVRPADNLRANGRVRPSHVLRNRTNNGISRSTINNTGNNKSFPLLVAHMSVPHPLILFRQPSM